MRNSKQADIHLLELVVVECAPTPCRQHLHLLPHHRVRESGPSERRRFPPRNPLEFVLDGLLVRLRDKKRPLTALEVAGSSKPYHFLVVAGGDVGAEVPLGRGDSVADRACLPVVLPEELEGFFETLIAPLEEENEFDRTFNC